MSCHHVTIIRELKLPLRSCLFGHEQISPAEWAEAHLLPEYAVHTYCRTLAVSSNMGTPLMTTQGTHL